MALLGRSDRRYVDCNALDYAPISDLLIRLEAPLELLKDPPSTTGGAFKARRAAFER